MDVKKSTHMKMQLLAVCAEEEDEEDEKVGESLASGMSSEDDDKAEITRNNFRTGRGGPGGGGQLHTQGERAEITNCKAKKSKWANEE